MILINIHKQLRRIHTGGTLIFLSLLPFLNSQTNFQFHFNISLLSHRFEEEFISN